MATINVSLGNERNRALFREQFGEDHEILEAPPGVDRGHVDLHILDGRALERYHETLTDLRTDSDPVFLPVLLVTGQSASGALPERVWDVITEVINTPVDRAVLDARVRNLLRQRVQSLELMQAKERSDARFRSLFDTAPDPMVAVRFDGTVTAANDAFGTLFRVAPAEAIGEPLRDLSPPESKRCQRVILEFDETTRDTFPRTIEWDTDGDRVKATELHVSTVEQPDETERIGVFRDVSDRVRRLRELREQNDRLEEFTKRLAHDLRNPLSIAQGSLKRARNTGAETAFEGIEEGMDRMEQLIEELLDIARGGKLVLDPSPHSLEETAREAWTTVETRDASLTVTATSEVLADRSRLCELLANLFRNAVEHVGPDVRVRVGAFHRGDVDGFFVEDDGPGIPLRDASMAFEVGYTTTEDGTGIGLRIVQEIATGHGWEVELAESDTGGARFEFTGVTSSPP